MTVPPTSGIPGIPGGAGWTGASSSSGAPVFVSPTPSASTNEQFELAGWGARFGAYSLDAVIRLVLAIAIAIGGFLIFADDPFSLPAYWTEGDFPSGSDAGDFNLFWLILTWLGVYFVSAAVYAPLFMARWRGATPGKKIVGIRVVHEGGADITLGQSILREVLCKGLLINGVGGSFVLPWLVSYLWPLWDRECRAGHDFMVKTRVVRAR